MKIEEVKYNLFRFCALKGIQILREREVQYGNQFTLKFSRDTIHLTVFKRRILVQGAESKLKEIMTAWSDNSASTIGAMRVMLPESWREWNTEANWLKEFHNKNGVPKSDETNHRYMMNRGSLFHAYMFRTKSFESVSFERFEYLIRNWFKRNCFMNINIDQFIIECREEVTADKYIDTTIDNVPFTVAADILSERMANTCHNKYYCDKEFCGCPQTEAFAEDCVIDIVDALYPYFSNQMLKYTKGNLVKLVNRDFDLTWADTNPSTPIEELMATGLDDAGILTMPQYQAWDSKHRYNIDFVVKTPQGINIAIECDGLQFHARPNTYIRDRKRDRYLQANGFYMMRFSSVEIFNELDNVLEEIDKSYWEIQKNKLDIRKPYRISYFNYNE